MGHKYSLDDTTRIQSRAVELLRNYRENRGDQHYYSHTSLGHSLDVNPRALLSLLIPISYHRSNPVPGRQLEVLNGRHFRWAPVE